MLLLGVVAGMAAGASAATIIPKPPSIAANGYLLIDAQTNEVLVEQNSIEPLPPASLTKIMTVYVAANELKAGRAAMDDEVLVSVKAWRTPGSRMFIREGRKVRLSDLLRGIIVQSGNDASVALAEHLAGSESAFADMMNQQAELLGMHASNFVNATGLPDEEHYTTASDLAKLTRALIDQHPEYYAIYSEREFEFNGIKQPNRNRLLWRDRTVDGVKTGHTDAAGYCLVASALRDDMRLISVVMGAKDDEDRMRESQKLLQYGFRYFETQHLYDANVALKTEPLWYGEQDTISFGVVDDVVVTIPRGRYEEVVADMTLPSRLEAPITAGDEVGELVLRLDDEAVYRAPLVALEDGVEAGVFSRAGDAVTLFFKDLWGD
ncbi:MAG: D-alanyl-D-alanine carboxypeptidase [Pseudomonadaceae bacterium]|nr:D-alanyl-D-alanine carboxypeptidase [Pseudomonadaceae bacterium]